MSEKQGHFTLIGKPPLLQFAITILIVMTIGVALFFVLFLAGSLIAGLDLANLPDNFFTDPGKENLDIFRYIVIIQDIAIFIVPALIVRNMLIPVDQKGLNDFSLPPVNEIVFVVVLAFCIFPVTGIAGELNGEMKLPEWLSGVEEWMITREEEASGLFDLLIPSDTIGLMFLNIFIIAVLPAISEELLFRGVLQRILYGFFRSPHSAIWVISILFSAMHLQFYGFVPRLILGLSFGYLYYWSGTLWLPVLAHFVNNAVPAIYGYFQGWESAGAGPDIALWKQLLFLPLPVTIAVMILLYFRNKFRLSAVAGKEMID